MRFNLDAVAAGLEAIGWDRSHTRSRGNEVSFSRYEPSAEGEVACSLRVAESRVFLAQDSSRLGPKGETIPTWVEVTSETWTRALEVVAACAIAAAPPGESGQIVDFPVRESSDGAE